VVTARNAFGRGQASSRLTATVGPPNTAIVDPLRRALTPTGQGARLSVVRVARGYAYNFSAVVPGELNVEWVYLPRGTHLGQAYGKVLPVLVASASVEIARGRHVKLKVKVTPAGRALLAGKRVVKLTAEGTFSPPGRPSVVATAEFALER
jgi:hypothetical protein